MSKHGPGTLLEALAKYGAHLPDCHPGVPAWMGWPCRCGLDEALGRRHHCEQCGDAGMVTGELDPVTRKYAGAAACPCRAEGT